VRKRHKRSNGLDNEVKVQAFQWDIVLVAGLEASADFLQSVDEIVALCSRLSMTIQKVWRMRLRMCDLELDLDVRFMS
jgi:hypothetical protein